MKRATYVIRIYLLTDSNIRILDSRPNDRSWLLLKAAYPVANSNSYYDQRLIFQGHGTKKGMKIYLKVLKDHVNSA